MTDRTEDMANDHIAIHGHQVKFRNGSTKRPGLDDDVDFFLTVASPGRERLSNDTKNARRIAGSGGPDRRTCSHVTSTWNVSLNHEGDHGPPARNDGWWAPPRQVHRRWSAAK